MTKRGGKARVVVRGETKYRATVNAVLSLGGKGMKVGVITDQPASSGKASLIDVAIWNEFGTRRIPARPFLRSTIEENRLEIGARFVKAEAAVVAGKMSPNAALAGIGKWMVARVRDKIHRGPWAPNAPSTVARKGFNKPLIHTRLLLAAINFAVFDNPAKAKRPLKPGRRR